MLEEKLKDQNQSSLNVFLSMKKNVGTKTKVQSVENYI